MIYSINNLDFDSFLFDYSSIIMPNDVVILSEGMVKGVNKLSNGETHSQLGQLLTMSKDKKCIFAVHTQLNTNHLPYNSVILIDNGVISATMNEIFADKNHSTGKELIFLESSIGLIACLVGNDIYYTELWRIYKIARPTVIIHLSRKQSDKKSLTMLKAFACSCGREIICNFKNLSCRINSDAVIKDIEFGCLRVLPRGKSLHQPLLVDKNIIIKKQFSL